MTTFIKKGTVTDKDMFVRGCLTQRMGLSMDLLVVDDARLNKLIQSTGGLVAYPGVKIYEDPVINKTVTG